MAHLSTTCDSCGSTNVQLVHEPRTGQWRGQCQDCWSLGAWSDTADGAAECWDCQPLKANVADMRRQADLRRRGGKGS